MSLSSLLYLNSPQRRYGIQKPKAILKYTSLQCPPCFVSYRQRCWRLSVRHFCLHNRPSKQRQKHPGMNAWLSFPSKKNSTLAASNLFPPTNVHFFNNLTFTIKNFNCCCLVIEGFAQIGGLIQFSLTWRLRLPQLISHFHTIFRLKLVTWSCY